MASNQWSQIERIVRRYQRAATVKHNLESNNLKQAIALEQRRSPIRYEPQAKKPTNTFQDNFAESGGKDLIDNLKAVLGQE